MALQVANGLDTPLSYGNDKQARVFTGCVYDIFRKAKITNIRKSDYFSILSDGSTDTSTQEEEIVYVRYLEDNIIPKTALKALEKADASSIHAALVSTLEGELEISDWKDRLVSGCFDGAAVNFQV